MPWFSTTNRPPKNSFPYRTRAKKAFYHHKSSAKQRGIDFLFTFEQWEAWWIKNLGDDWLEKRGSTKNKYCMARKGDSGPYSVENVKCKTVSENARNYHKLLRRVRL